ncbi:MAG: GNAT family N-acetyltransferase [Leptothrix sp. (in: b-proteobacteria)]
MSAVQLEVVDTLDAVDAGEWTALTGADPFTDHAFLALLEATGCASAATGWLPRHLLLRRAGRLVGAVPVYLKSHSRGEFVFDHAWAQAYERHGLTYYPKLVVAVPFTPVAGPRLLVAGDAEVPADMGAADEVRALLAQGLIELTRRSGASSVHVLFCGDADRTALHEAGFLIREGVQFHWRNQADETGARHASFDAFLATMSHDKRKKLKQDRKRVASAGITFRWLEGAELTPAHLAFFYACYERTYEAHWSSPYLSADFYPRLHAAEPDRLMLVLAERDGAPVACALNVKGRDPGDGVRVYGRYWGTTEFVSGLHFETCYAQSIDYCIARGHAVFEGGAQGEHKMARGLMPVRTHSAHWIADRRFADAIGDFVGREAQAIDGYVDELQASSPFKASGAATSGASVTAPLGHPPDTDAA